MGRNAYINFYVWFYNEHRGQAPVTVIAKRAGITWRKMTPQERDRFTDRNLFPKGNVPLYLVKRKRGLKNSVASKIQGKKRIKPSRQSKQSSHFKKGGHGKVKKNVLEKSNQDEIQVKSNQQMHGKGEKEEKKIDDNKNKESNNNNSEEEEEPEEITARRKSIERWMDENHYT